MGRKQVQPLSVIELVVWPWSNIASPSGKMVGQLLGREGIQASHFHAESVRLYRASVNHQRRGFKPRIADDNEHRPGAKEACPVPCPILVHLAWAIVKHVPGRPLKPGLRMQAQGPDASVDLAGRDYAGR